ncbi:unnamed protein product [Rhizoctonia solani]|uniref:Uncharacterized protein n=1 Tax=Rhizoctonia solani TaxID=456999 RepID=A0A8H3GZE0_9AGAM|nr:unnamed protein product [Rhizoctonia solani]
MGGRAPRKSLAVRRARMMRAAAAEVHLRMSGTQNIEENPPTSITLSSANDLNSTLDQEVAGDNLENQSVNN